VDKKSFIIHDLKKLKQYRDLLIGIVLDFVLPPRLDLQKRYNVIYAIRSFITLYSCKILRSIVIEENGTTEHF